MMPFIWPQVCQQLTGIKNKGFIKEGFDADLAVLDKNLEVVMTIVGGKIKYERE